MEIARWRKKKFSFQNSPLWTKLCRCKFASCVNALLQMELKSWKSHQLISLSTDFELKLQSHHTKGRSPEWALVCFHTLLWLGKCFPHNSHLYLLSVKCFAWWATISSLVSKRCRWKWKERRKKFYSWKKFPLQGWRLRREGKDYEEEAFQHVHNVNRSKMRERKKLEQEREEEKRTTNKFIEMYINYSFSVYNNTVVVVSSSSSSEKIVGKKGKAEMPERSGSSAHKWVHGTSKASKKNVFF